MERNLIIRLKIYNIPGQIVCEKHIYRTYRSPSISQQQDQAATRQQDRRGRHVPRVRPL